MDEQTPHIHIDFLPFIRNSKRGLDTRVSLKGALSEQLGTHIFSSLSRNVSNNAFILHHVLLYDLSHIFTNEYCPHVIPFYYLIKGCGIFAVGDYRVNPL